MRELNLRYFVARVGGGVLVFDEDGSEYIDQRDELHSLPAI